MTSNNSLQDVKAPVDRRIPESSPDRIRSEKEEFHQTKGPATEQAAYRFSFIISCKIKAWFQTVKRTTLLQQTKAT